MAFTARDIKDRIVQFPKRYKLKDINTGNVIATYDLEADVGTITEVGTVLNKAHLQPLEDGLKSAFYEIPMISYMAFCTNANANSLDSAFGKNNEDRIMGIGRQLAMYAWFKGDSKITYPFTNLIQCNTLNDILNNPNALQEMSININIMEMLTLSPYGTSIILNSSNYANLLLSNQQIYDTFIASSTLFSKVITLSTTMNIVLSDVNGLTNITNSAKFATFTGNTSAMGLMFSNAQCLKNICSSVGLTNSYKNIAQSYRANIKTSLDNATTLFTKASVKYSGTGTGLKDGALNTDTILLPTYSDKDGPYSNNSDRYAYFGTDSAKVIWSALGGTMQSQYTITTGVSMRGIYFIGAQHANATPNITCDTYTVK